MRLKFDTNKAVGLSAMFISFTTLVIFIYQTHLMRVESHLSIMPRLVFNQVSQTTDSSTTIRYEVWNKGLGPAVIEAIFIKANGKYYNGNIQQFLQDNYPTILEQATGKSTTNLALGSTISEDEKVVLIELEIPLSKIKSIENIVSTLHRKELFDIEIIYQSIYKERWKIRFNSKDAEPVEL